MKRLAALLGALIMLTGCSITIDSKPSESPSAAPTATVSNDAAYLAAVREDHPELDTVPDSLLLDHAEKVCNVFDAGGDLNDVLNNDGGLPPELKITLVAGAIAYYCPEYEHLTKQSPTDRI